MVDAPTLVPGVDLELFEFDVEFDGFDLPADTLAWGDGLVGFTGLVNKGDTDAGPFTITLALSSDAVFDSADTVLAEVPVASLPSGALLDQDIFFVLPAAGSLPDGDYHIVALVDSGLVIDEANETNNQFDEFVFIGQGGGGTGDVDLTVNNVTLPPEPLVWGGFVDVQAEIANNGSGAV